MSKNPPLPAIGAWIPSPEIPAFRSTRGECFVLTPGHANQIAPGKRPRVTLSPTIVTKDGQPYFTMSTPGDDNQDQAMLQVLLNLLDFEMTPLEAVEVPRCPTTHFFATFGFHEFNAGKVSLESRIPRATVQKLGAIGACASARLGLEQQVRTHGHFGKRRRSARRRGSAPGALHLRAVILQDGAVRVRTTDSLIPHRQNWNPPNPKHHARDWRDGFTQVSLSMSSHKPSVRSCFASFDRHGRCSDRYRCSRTSRSRGTVLNRYLMSSRSI